MTDRAPAAPLYEAVIRALTQKGMTKVQLHQRSGVARSTVEGWRTRPTPPHAPTVLAVADALGMDRAEALRLGGVMADITAVREGTIVDLSEVDIDVLLAEIRRRVTE